MKICVIGLGYVGAVTSCCLAKDGHQVIGVDVDPVKVNLLREGTSPIIEEGVDEITQQAVSSGNLTVMSELDTENIASDLVFVCVGTPSADNGSQDLTALQRVCQQIGEQLKSIDSVPAIVIRSTIPPGTTEGLVQQTLEQSSGKVAGTGFGLGFQPEFLREGSSVKDFYNPPMTVIGGDAVAAQGVRSLFEEFPGEFVVTDIKSAELLKVACNTFHALKVNFANEIGRLAQVLDMDSRIVMALLCKDTQLNISPAYLRPGFAFGGSCLPKDLRALLHMAKSNDVDLPMLQGILPSNDQHIAHVAQKVMSHSSRKVGLVGLSFKQGTDDLRESPMVKLAEILIGKGYELSIYDPAVRGAMLLGANKRFIESTIPHFAGLLRESLETTVLPGSSVIVAHRYPELDALIQSLSSDTKLIDLVGIDAPSHVQYTGVAW